VFDNAWSMGPTLLLQVIVSRKGIYPAGQDIVTGIVCQLKCCLGKVTAHGISLIMSEVWSSWVPCLFSDDQKCRHMEVFEWNVTVLSRMHLSCHRKSCVLNLGSDNMTYVQNSRKVFGNTKTCLYKWSWTVLPSGKGMLTYFLTQKTFFFSTGCLRSTRI